MRLSSTGSGQDNPLERFPPVDAQDEVFIARVGDHYRTRLTHTLEVAQISRMVAAPWGLMKTRFYAIALGHDSGAYSFRAYRGDSPQ